MKRTLFAWLVILGGSMTVHGQVLLSTYVGGPAADKLSGAAVAPDGTIVLAGNLSATDLPAFKGAKLYGTAGDGVIVRLSPNADTVFSVTRYEGTLSDLKVDAQGNILIAGSFGAARLEPTGAKAVWTIGGGDKEARIAIGPDGGAVLLANKQINLLAADGRTLASWPASGGYVNDVAFDPVSRLIVVCGFDNKKGTVPGQKTEPVQVAFVRAYNLDGQEKWSAYGWQGQEVADLQLMADTRAYRLAVGGDGKLYVGGESAGGNTMWMRGSLDLKEKLTMPKGDKFQNAYNTSANHITFVGRLDARTGMAEAGTLLLARLPNDKGNALRPRALAVDEAGRVYVGGMSASSPPVSSGAFGDTGDGGGAFFCVFNPDFNRVYATKLASDQTAAIAVGKDVIVAVGSGKDRVTPVSAWQKESAGDVDGFAVVFSRAAAEANAAPIAPVK